MSRKISSRNPNFNKYIKGDYIYSIVDATATNSTVNIKLLDYNDYIYKSGKEINDYSKENNTYKYFKKESEAIETDLDDLQECYIFGSPMKIVMDNIQQYNNCGVDAILNNLALAGIKKITNQNKIETDFTKELWSLGFADDKEKFGMFDYNDGGTDPSVYKEVFEYYGINSEEHFGKGDKPDIDILTLANYIKNGGSAIVGVSSELLWYGENAKEENIEIDHAITLTGVVYDTKNPVCDFDNLDNSTVPLGFFIHDTGGWITRYISYNEFESVTLKGKLEVDGKIVNGIFATIITDDIKKNTDNINAFGSNKDNIIYGNSANNTIKGYNGDDVLVGASGNDTIYGGAGDDIIFANGIVKDDYIDFIENNELKTKIINVDYVSSKVDDGLFIGRNFIYGGAGKDCIFGGEYNDTIDGGAGDDYIFGGAGIDVIKGGAGKDYIDGGAGNDRLYGGAGDDYISGGLGDDTIIAGSGNDTILGETGCDMIECGSGDDIVILDKNCDTDYVYSTAGSVTLSFKDKDNLVDIKDLTISLTDKNSKIKNLEVFFSNLSDGVVVDNFYNSKKNSSKKVYILDEVHEKSYRISATKSTGKIKVANTGGNNVLISTSVKNNNIVTSSGNDIVYMLDGNDVITYTSGEDYYFSEQGNNTYNMNSFDKNSFLSLNDCTDIIGKTDSQGQPLSPSLDDVLNFKSNSADDLMLFFDITSSGKINDTSLYFIDKNEITVTSDYLLDVTDNNATGIVQIKEYFLKSNPTATSNYKGFGCIETITAESLTIDIDKAIKQIVSEVVSWFDGKVYTSVSNAIKSDAENISDLIKIFTSTELNLK